MISPLTPVAALLCVCSIVRALAAGGHAAGAEQLPAAVRRAAEAFAAAPHTNRFAEAQNLCRELPKCPLRYDRDVGTGRYRSYDFSRPSYVLSTDALLKLLGPPTAARTNDTPIHLLYPARASHDAPTQKGWFLDVQIVSDRVVFGNMATYDHHWDPVR